MKIKNVIINVVIILLCSLAIIINYYYEDYNAIGAGCIILMGIIAIFKKTKQ